MQQQTMQASEAAGIDPRFPASAVPSIAGLRLSPGDAVDLVNISRSGVLVEGRTRFVPGTRVTVIFEGTFTPAQIKGRVVRCMVSSLSGGTLRYQSGIQFEKKLEANPNELGVPALAMMDLAVPVVTGSSPPAPPAPKTVRNRW